MNTKLSFGKRLVKTAQKKLKTPPFYTSYEELSRWYKTPLGQKWLSLQMKWVNDEIGCLFGYHLMQVGISAGEHFCKSSRIHHCFNVSPVHVDNSCNNAPQMLADAQNLPLADESIDVTIMHHALDFSDNPQQVLKEATRVTVPRGYIILIGFNPNSFWGVYQFFARFWSRKSVLRQNRLRLGRVKDWLALLSFSTLKTSSLSHALPINSSRYISRTQKLKAKLPDIHLPMGNIYFILARKDKAGLTPIKPQWQDKKLLGAAVMPKQSVPASAKNHYADILPLRRRNRKTID